MVLKPDMSMATILQIADKICNLFKIFYVLVEKVISQMEARF
jgi:hypothetical protein